MFLFEQQRAVTPPECL